MTRFLVLVMFVVPVVVGCGGSSEETADKASDENKTTDVCGKEAAGNEKKESSVLKKTTQEIGKYDPAAGRKISSSKINATNPLTAGLDAYGPGMQKVSEIAVTKRVAEFNALKGHYPSYEEFMDEIIKGKNPIHLPVLPYKKEYQYDEANHKLVVVEPLEEAADDKKAE